MRLARLNRVILASFVVLATPIVAHAQDILASAPVDLSVTVYRDPHRSEGGFDLDYLNGFALITETRRVVIPPGLHRLRFEGVADGIEPASAIVTGLPSGVLEKNRDAALLSPSALIASAEAQGGRVLYTRAGPAGTMVRAEGRIASGADGGVVIETADGVEALRCSGLPETVTFESAGTGLSALPTLSVLTRASETMEAVVQLSYLARGFDWASDYVVNLAGDGRKVDLGGWVTLANSNGVSFPNARVQVVAGKLNRDTGEIEPIDVGQPILAYCWPQGSTSDPSPPITIERAYPLGFEPDDYADSVFVTASRRAMPAPSAPPMQDAALPVSAFTMEEAEDLGDLKLYRVPDRTTVSSRQSKQVRLLDKLAVPVSRVYEVSYSAASTIVYAPATVILRTRNDKKNNLGIPLPSGRVSVFETVGRGASSERLLAGETSLRDLAVDEETEIRMTGGAAVQSQQVNESRELVVTPRSPPPFVAGMNPRATYRFDDVSRVELTNAHPFAIQAEVRIFVGSGQEIMRADRPVATKNGQPIFRINVPANSSVEIRYQTARRP